MAVTAALALHHQFLDRLSLMLVAAAVAFTAERRVAVVLAAAVLLAQTAGVPALLALQTLAAAAAVLRMAAGIGWAVLAVMAS
jgi:hypothetical protein